MMSSMRKRSLTRPNSVLPSPLAASLALTRKMPVPIRIESCRTALCETMVPERAKIGARRLRGGKAQRRQTPRRIVNEHDQRAARAAPFKPVMRAAVDLDQFAKARPPVAPLKHPLVTPPLRLP